jgi:pSer/pThr/pTyr-binding forkhead associated (FHA) protein
MNYQILIYLDAIQPPITQNLNSAIYRLGRNSTCDILVLDKYISRYHCTLVLMPPDKDNVAPYYSIIDGMLMTGTKSTGGTWVNGRKVNNFKLNHQDVITFGSRPYPKIIFIAEISEIRDDGTFSEQQG